MTRMAVSNVTALLAFALCIAPPVEPRDPEVPWDTKQLERDITPELRRVERLPGDFDRFEVLAWRRIEKASPIVPLQRARLDIALLWGRTHAPQQWALVQAFTWWGDEDRWRRSVFWRELIVPLAQTRPGEDKDGTWHAYAPYDHPPSSREICEFAQVSFLDLSDEADYHVMSRGVRLHAWLDVAGAEPACHIGVSE